MDVSREVGAAYPRGIDPASWGRHLHIAHDHFLDTGKPAAQVRRVVADSWRRSLEHGADPEVPAAPVRLDGDELAEFRTEHPLSSVMPVIRRLLVDSATDAGLVVAVSDALGRLLWVEGHSDLRTRAQDMHFVEGADWSESAVGTNAPGTALAIGRPVAIFGAEHLARPVTPWSCSAAPIHDPVTGDVLGVLDVTGGDEVASAQSLSLVRATVAAVEAELRVNGLLAGPSVDPNICRLQVLGRHQGELHYRGGMRRLSLRHSEMLVLLSDATDGLAAEELAVGLNGGDQAPVTIRAEISRLRTALRPIDLWSRPYRLEVPLRTDLHDVHDRLDAGDADGAIAAYRGSLLPESDAPGVVALREELDARMRSVR